MPKEENKKCDRCDKKAVEFLELCKCDHKIPSVHLCKDCNRRLSILLHNVLHQALEVFLAKDNEAAN